jgi:hypothetical protein
MSTPDDAAPPATQPSPPSVELPDGSSDGRELLLGWLGFLRSAVLRKLDGLGGPRRGGLLEGRLLPLLGIINHSTHFEARWLDGGMRGEAFSRDEAEFSPRPQLSVDAARDAYRTRADAADAFVRASASLNVPCLGCQSRPMNGLEDLAAREQCHGQGHDTGFGWHYWLRS